MTESKVYTKESKSSEELLQQLKERGLVVEDETNALHYMKHVGYYRLSGYTLLLETPGTYTTGGNGRTLYHRTHRFRESVTFQNLIDLYDLDRRLRLHVLDAIERIEVSFRSLLCDHMANKYSDPHWYMRPTLFSRRYQNKRSDEPPCTLHEELLGRISEETFKHEPKKRNAFCNHYYERYSEPKLPPCWMIAEQLSFGAWSITYENLAQNQDKKVVADTLGGTVRNVESWVRSISYLSNLCAHHARLLGIIYVLVPRMSADLQSSLAATRVPDRSKQFIALAAVIHYLLRTISPQSQWSSRMYKLLKKYANIDVEDLLGFFPDWESDSFWNVTLS